jgi:hypothetical protein
MRHNSLIFQGIMDSMAGNGKRDHFTIATEDHMRRALLLVLVFCLASLCLEAAGQSSQAASSNQAHGVKDRQTVDLPPAIHTFRPRLPLQDALKIAEAFILKEHIDISSYWLYRAIFILSGDENTPDKDKLPCWHFWWVNDSGAMGDYVEIIVTMDGKAGRAPSM